MIKIFKKLIYPLLFFTAVIGSIACSDQPAEKEKIQYIIGSENKRDLGPGPFDPTEPPPPPAPFYAPINIILTGRSDIYVHRVFPFYKGYSHDYYHPIPVALTKWDIRKIGLEELPQFLTEEYTNSNNNRQFTTCIKSPSDTIKNEAFPIILAFFKERKFDAYIIRKWIDQEQEAIKSFDKE